MPRIRKPNPTLVTKCTKFRIRASAQTLKELSGRSTGNYANSVDSSVYCTWVCDPRCCGSRNVARVSSTALDPLEDCGWRNRFDSSKSSTYRKNGTRFAAIWSNAAAGDGFIGVDTVTVGSHPVNTINFWEKNEQMPAFQLYFWPKLSESKNSPGFHYIFCRTTHK